MKDRNWTPKRRTVVKGLGAVVAAPLAAPEFSAEALQLLKTQPWAGNIRELQNVIERALILSEDEAVIRPEHLLLADTSFRTAR